MHEIRFNVGELSEYQQKMVTGGFERHSDAMGAPRYNKELYYWTISEPDGVLIAALTADVLWDWMYIDELWVDEKSRSHGLGSKLVKTAEAFALDGQLTGIWLWTQSWQAAEFYEGLGFQKFTEFPDFPKGHQRFGLRKNFT